MARSTSSADAPASWQGHDLILRVQVQPRARRDEITGRQGGTYKVRLTAPPVDGQANAALCEFLAEIFGVAKSRVFLLRGDTSRQKLLRIAAPARLPAELEIPPKSPA